MGRLYLHVGTPKTGTSAIQVFLGKNREVLKKKGYSYPDFGITFEGIGTNRNAHFLVHRYFDSNEQRDYERENEVQEKALSLLLKDLEDYDAVIMSDEGIWNHFELFEDFWQKLYDRITNAGHTLDVIVYLRRQDTFIQSYWAQQVKETSTVSFQEFMQKRRYEKCHLEYNTALGQIADVLGTDHIIVRIYEKGQYYGDSLISDFLHQVGLELTEEFKAPDKIVNQSIAGKSLEIKRILNAMPEFSEKKSFIVDYLKKLTVNEEDESGFSRAACFLPGQQEEFMELYTKENESVARNYLKKENGVLFEEEGKSSVGEAAEYSKEELVMACGEIILRLERQLRREKKKNVFFKKVRKKFKSLKKKK